VKGKSQQVQNLGDLLISCKGVRHGLARIKCPSLSRSSSGKPLPRNRDARFHLPKPNSYNTAYLVVSNGERGAAEQSRAENPFLAPVRTTEVSLRNSQEQNEKSAATRLASTT
jgi:hypothetical protein